jgi:3-oxoacyl-[acyl-carrier protein] reductase
MDLNLTDKVALITAASKGLGLAAAQALAAEGAHVVISAHSQALESAAEEIRRETGRKVLAVRADLTQAADIQSLVDRTLAEFGRIDILILNSAGPRPGPFLELTPQDWEAAFQLVVMSAVRVCYAVVPHMIERGSGSIVASQSYTVRHPSRTLHLSNSLRLAVLGLMKSLADDLGPKGIRVNSINPGWTLTDRVEEIMRDRAQRNGTTVEEEMARAKNEIPLGRLAQVEEYARAVAWLASPAASYVHGHALMIDGGISRSPL